MFIAVFLALMAGGFQGVWGAVEQQEAKGTLPMVVVRNPFQPPPVVTKKLLQMRRAKTRVPQSPLEKYDVESFVLTGIVADMAMVVSPDGSTYIIRKGTKIGRNGEVVVGIYADRVAIRRGKKIIYLTFPKD